jgi:hypothetical protein
MSAKWFEVWADPSLLPPYILLILSDGWQESAFVVIDPQEDQRQIYAANDYEKVKMWLLEDEYELVPGRVFVD